MLKVDKGSERAAKNGFYSSVEKRSVELCRETLVV